MSAQTQNPAYGQFMQDSAGRVQQMGAQGAAGLRTGVQQGLAAVGVSEDPEYVARTARAAAGTAMATAAAPRTLPASTARPRRGAPRTPWAWTAWGEP